MTTRLAGAALACAVFGIAPAADAQTLKGLVFGGRPSSGRDFSAPPVARYVSEDGDVFVLDLSNARTPLLKFETSAEVWVLQPQPAPRGDVIYKNDVGQPVLRATRLGGITVFTQHRPGGEAAAASGRASPLRLPTLTPQALFEQMALASVRASRSAQQGIVFDAEVTPGSSALVADAAVVTYLAIERLSKQPQGRRRLAGLRRVLMVEGRRPAAQVERDTLKITVVASLGHAGRPSSSRIAAAMAAPDR